MVTTDIFVDAAMKPYKFYLCPPLNQSSRLIQMIENNGGEVVTDYTQTCIIISSKENPIPENLKGAHIYSYEFIQDSANRGSQQQFPNYLMHVPQTSNESIPHQFNDKDLDVNLDDVDVDVDADEVANFDFETLRKDIISGNHINSNGDDLDDDINDDLDDEIGDEIGDIDDDIDVDEYAKHIAQGHMNAQLDSNLSNVFGDVNQNDIDNLNNIHMTHNTSNNNNDNNNNDNGAHSNNKISSVSFETMNVRYFNAEEDNILKEELRKRHYMGIKGHGVYEIIAQLPFFKARQRTATSLRERMRTLKYNLGYVYKLDKRNKLLKDENGQYIKTTKIKSKLTPYIAADDLIFCKTIYYKLDIETDEKGFETVVFPTNFYDKFANVYDSHTAESWRQRCKNYILVFGVANYLKYYIMQVKQNKVPLPANQANKEWLNARKHIRKSDCPKLYFPNVPQDNSFIDDNLEYTIIKGYDKPFDYENPFRSIKRLKLNSAHGEYSSNNINVSNSDTNSNSITNSSIDHDNLEHDLTTDNINSLDVSNSLINDPETMKLNKQIEEAVGRDTHSYYSSFDNINDVTQGMNVMTDETLKNIGSMSNAPKLIDNQVSVENNQSHSMRDLPISPFSGKDSSVREFIDEPTTEFLETSFRKNAKKSGSPIDLTIVPDKEELCEKFKEIFGHYNKKDKLKPLELSEKLTTFGVKKYYTIFLIYRCASVRQNILDSLINYVRTNGHELLVTRPGVWSNKSIEYFDRKDPDIVRILKAYHGEEAFKKKMMSKNVSR